MTETEELYLRVIWAMTRDGQGARTGALAAKLGVSGPSVSAMLTRLSNAGVTERTADRRVRLTLPGEAEALRVVRRHRLLETFLYRVVGLPLHELHAEADRLERGISERLEARISELLGDPSTDPHGDPIPRSGHAHREQRGECLADVTVGKRFRVERVSDVDPEALRHLAALHILPGVVLRVDARDAFGGPLWVRRGRSRVGLPPALTILVHGSTLPSEP